MKFKYGLHHGSCHETIQPLHNKLFPTTNVTVEWFNWFNSRVNSMTQPPRVYTLHDDDLLVGLWCVEPKQLQTTETETIPVGRCYSVGIHPDYRRRDLFVQLSKFAIAEERSRGEYEYILGFPQVGRHVVAGHLKAGWVSTQFIDALSAKPAICTSLRSVERVTDFSSIDVRQYAGAFVNSSNFRNERWLKHPDCQYTIVSSRGGFIVLKPYGSLCHILDIEGDDRTVRYLLDVSRTLARRHNWSDVTIWCAKNDPHRRDVLAAGFETSPVITTVELLSVQIKAKIPLEFCSTHFQMGNEEMY